MQKSMEERLVISGTRDGWLDKYAQGLAEVPGFRDINVNPGIYQVNAKYKKGTVWGDLLVTLTPSGGDSTEVLLRSSAHVDNVYALFASPNRKLLAAAKTPLG